MRFTLVAIVCSLPALAQQSKPANRIVDGNAALLATGTRIPLTVMSTVSSKNAAPGDQVYLRTMVPIAVDGRIVIPEGAFVQGTITESKRPGKVKGKGELSLSFDSLMFADGRSIDLSGRIGSMSGDNPGTLDRAEGKVSSDGAEGQDTIMLAAPAAGGAMMGRWIGGEGRDAGIGAGAGAAAGAMAVLLTRGPEAVLRKGSSVDMILSRDIRVPLTRRR